MIARIAATMLVATLTTNVAAQTPAPRDSATTTLAAATAPKTAPPSPRAGWLSDRLPLRVGDLLTIVIDESAAASERVSTTATADRAQRAKLNAGVDALARLGPLKDFATGMENSSRDVGESGRRGELSAVLTVRVTDVTAGGVATIQGAKNVTVDGRAQLVEVRGLVRAEDISSANTIPSSRIADAVITYKGKKIAPRSGILGKILSILWP